LVSQIADTASKWLHASNRHTADRINTLKELGWRILGYALLPVILAAKLATNAVLIVGTLIYWILCLAVFAGCVYFVGYVLFHTFLSAYSFFEGIDAELRKLRPPPAGNDFWIHVYPFVHHFGIFAILIPVLGACVAVVILVWLAIQIVKFLISLPSRISNAAHKLRQAIGRLIQAIWRRLIHALQTLTWRQALLLLVFISCGTAIVWLSWQCGQSRACRETAPWIVAVVAILLPLPFIRFKREGEHGFSIQIFSFKIIEKGAKGLVIFGVSLISIALVSVTFFGLTAFTYAVWAWSGDIRDLVADYLIPPAIQKDAEERVEPDTVADATKPPPSETSMPSNVASANLFPRAVYWRNKSALELRERWGGQVELSDVPLDANALCSYAFIMVVGAASPDGTELMNTYFSRQRALSTGLIIRNWTIRCQNPPPIIATSLNESIAGLPDIEGRRLRAFGVGSVDNSEDREIHSDSLDELIAGFLQANTEASIAPEKLQPEHCAYDGGEGKVAFKFGTCREQW